MLFWYLSWSSQNSSSSTLMSYLTLPATQLLVSSNACLQADKFLDSCTSSSTGHVPCDLRICSARGCVSIYIQALHIWEQVRAREWKPVLKQCLEPFLWKGLEIVMASISPSHLWTINTILSFIWTMSGLPDQDSSNKKPKLYSSGIAWTSLSWR